MSAPARPKVGDVVWCRGVVEAISHDPLDLFIRWHDRHAAWVAPPAIHHIGDHPPAPERKPWDVLREAAEILPTHYPTARVALRDHADALERAAAPPDPVAVLREISSKVSLSPDWRARIDAAIAAHDAKKKEG